MGVVYNVLYWGTVVVVTPVMVIYHLLVAVELIARFNIIRYINLWKEGLR